MASVSLSKIKKSFGSVEVLHGIDLEIVKGEFVVFVGPSGCGKSTMLRIIAGLEEITSGTLVIDGEVSNGVPPGERGIAMVFQSYALYPHMTVYQNMAFGLKVSGMPKAEIDQRVRRAADMLQLTSYLDRHPRNLSGGQRQRVAIGRAVTRDPKVFLFDEPLSNLDAALRVATRIEIANLKDKMPDATMIYVTHDQVEAMTLADRIVVFHDGRIEQIGTPLDLYDRPQNLFVAQFIGSPEMNIVKGKLEVDAGATDLRIESGATLSLGRAHPFSADDNGKFAYVGIRPEHLHHADGTTAKLSGEVLVSEKLGELTNVHVDIGVGHPVIAKFPRLVDTARGDRIHMGFDDADLHFFDENGQRWPDAAVAAPAA
ncbi:ABC transporter ATP-binding protein [Martelella soudanensis]|uniref:ABC transporter ATP-binding protein n=1 Tax=unclassified Martelella TaxID=2629616 RepID=UPI0015DE1128|nr:MULTISPECIES: sn-glycerol-3-phosphate ABC transporter ATP-binding protein UgpC [unclassified Martelella]